MKKSFIILIAMILLTASFISAQTANDPALKTFINNFSARNFTTDAVTKAQLDIILQAGIRSPSAGNRQPWLFTVVQNLDFAKQLVPQATAGNALIVVSAAGDGKTNGAAILDCALAVQSIYLAAQAIGLGSRIYTGPMDNINRSFKTQLGLPAGHSAVAVVRIGCLPAGTDAVSSASARNSADRMVIWK